MMSRESLLSSLKGLSKNVYSILKWSTVYSSV